MNATSSRSHSIFILNITQIATDGDDLSALGNASKLILVDLAGSESQKSTNTAGDALKEGTTHPKLNPAQPTPTSPPF